jgi:hypothetical protein
MNFTESVIQAKLPTATIAASPAAPVAGKSYHLSVIRESSESHCLVRILARDGEWCTVMDLRAAYGVPNPATSERIHWSNAHFQFQPLAARSTRPAIVGCCWTVTGLRPKIGRSRTSQRRTQPCAAAGDLQQRLSKSTPCRRAVVSIAQIVSTKGHRDVRGRPKSSGCKK